MAVVNLTETLPVVQKYNSLAWRWTGNQGLVANDIVATIATDKRPVRAMIVHMLARNITIPSTATSVFSSQFAINGTWFSCGRVASIGEATVAAGGATWTWLRNTIGAKANSAGGAAIIYTPFYDDGPNASAIGLAADSWRLYMSGSSLVSTAVSVGTPGTNVTAANPCSVTSTTHGLSTNDRVCVSAATGSASWAAMVGSSYGVVVLSPDVFTLVGVDSSTYGTCTAFSWGADVTFTKIGVDLVFA